MKNNCTLTLVRGIPGSGKTHFSNEIMSGNLRLENDMYFIHNGKYCYDKSKMPEAIGWCYSLAEECMRLGIDCCISNTFTRKRFIDGYAKLAARYDANFRIYRMMGEFTNVHNVPEEVLKNMSDNFEAYEGELFVYPNLNQDKDDPCYRPYIFTDHTIGDIIELDGHKVQIDKIVQGTYDYLNVFYRELDTGKEGITTCG